MEGWKTTDPFSDRVEYKSIRHTRTLPIKRFQILLLPDLEEDLHGIPIVVHLGET
jgi:hypothetical protein